MVNKKSLKSIPNIKSKKASKGIIKLLIADHKLMRNLMKKIKGGRITDFQKILVFKELVKVIKSHVLAEENNFLNLIKDHKKFADNATEGFEEHRVHEYVLASIRKLKDKKRKVEQMKVFCEILEHHLDEEEEELFPKFRKYTALSTRKKIGHKFLNTRSKTDTSLNSSKKGSLKYAATENI